MSKYIHSSDALPQSLHLWNNSPMQIGILDTRIIDINPQTSLDTSDEINFTIPKMADYMLDKVQILSEIRVLTVANENPAVRNNVSTAPHLAAALFKNVIVNIGGQQITQSFDQSYSMFKFWDDILHSRIGTLPRLEICEGLTPDDVDSKDNSENRLYFKSDETEPVNKAGVKRAQKIAQGHKVTLISDFNISVFKQDKLLPSNLEIQVNLVKNTSEFILLAAADNSDKVIFDKVLLRCTLQKPTDIILNLLEERLAKQAASFHADKSVMSLFPIPTGSQ